MKKAYSFTLDNNLMKELDQFCKDGLITKSKLINKIIQDFINQEKNKNVKNDIKWICKNKSSFKNNI